MHITWEPVRDEVILGYEPYLFLDNIRYRTPYYIIRYPAMHRRSCFVANGDDGSKVFYKLYEAKDYLEWCIANDYATSRILYDNGYKSENL